MSRFPRLELMRAQVKQRDDAIAGPYKAALRSSAETVSGLRQTVRKMEDFLGKEIARDVTEQIAHSISRKLMGLIYNAVATAKREWPEPVQIMLEPDLLRFMDPESIERAVLRQYTSRTLPSLCVRLDQAPDEWATIVDIRVPELGYRQVIS